MSLNMKMEGNLKGAGAYDEVRKWQKLEIYRIASIVLIFTIGFFTVWPLQKLVEGNSHAAYSFYPVFGQVLANNINFFAFIAKTYVPLFQKLLAWDMSGWNPLDWRTYPPIVLLGWIVLMVIVPTGFAAANKYSRTPNIFGKARWAKEDDIEEMAERDLAGFDDWVYTTKYRLRDWKKRVKARFRRLYSRVARMEPMPGKTNLRKSLFILGKFKNRYLRMGETLSVLLLAPPGTGKSVGFIVPSIVELDNACMTIHDQKPELWDMTAGHRQKVGPCYLLKWAAEDQPNGQLVDERQAMTMDPTILIHKDGKPFKDPDTGLYKTVPLYYPTWNPLSLKNVPPAAGTSRGSYISRLSQTLCPDKTGDNFFTSKARMAITGLTHFLVHKVEAAMSDDIKWHWDRMPDQWKKREPSYPMLVDFFAYGQAGYGGEDPIRDFLKDCIDEAKALDKEYQRVRGISVMNTAIVELSGLMVTNPTTRGSIISTFDEAMGPFKMESVRQRTSSSDLSFNQLRGVPKPEAREREEAKVLDAKKRGVVYKPQYAKNEWQPVSVYISVDLQNARQFSTITSIFIDSANAYLVSNDWNSVDDQGNQLGPFAHVFLIDEAPQLGKLDTIMNGPAVGRSKHISYVIVGQDFGQFEQKYSRPEVETLKSTTAIKIVLTQNNENTAKQIAEMVGKMTFEKISHSDRPAAKGLEGLIKGKGKSASQSLEGVEFLKPSFLTSMPKDKHVVLVQNYMDRPIFCDTPKFFMETKKRNGQPSIADKVLNLRSFAGPKPGAPMPIELMDQAAKRLEEFREQMAAVQAATAAEAKAGDGSGTQAQSPESFEPEDLRRAIVLTPKDISSMARDEEFRCVGDGVVHPYVVFTVMLPEEIKDLPYPSQDDLLITHNVQEVSKHIGSMSYFIWSEDRLGQELNQELARKQEKLIAGSPIFLKNIAIKVNEQSIGDMWHLGFQGGPNMDAVATGSDPDKEFCARWATDVVSFLIATDSMQEFMKSDEGLTDEELAAVDKEIAESSDDDAEHGSTAIT